MFSKRELQVMSKINKGKADSKERKVKEKREQSLKGKITDKIREADRAMIAAAKKGRFSAEVEVTDEIKYAVESYYRDQGYQCGWAGNARTIYLIIKWEK